MGDAYWGTAEISEKHLFEKFYGSVPTETWPLDKLTEAEPVPFARAKLPTPTAAWVYANGRAVGRSDNYILGGNLTPT